MIDTEACLRRRWFSLTYNTRSALESNKHGSSILSVRAPDFGVGEVRWGKKGVLGSKTPTYMDIQEACRRSAADGYFCYDEMFMWAKCLLATAPEVVDVLRNRFPILLIDEAQDNNKIQTEILSRIFLEGDKPVIRQRFGDVNQAIFDFQGAEEASIDKFPSEKLIALPNSHRFGQTLADLADPLGIQPYGLQGLGPKKPLISGSAAGAHTVFLFDDNSAGNVLCAYGDLILETFSDIELSHSGFVATAVGQVHRPPDQNDAEKFPHHVGHYWPDYLPELAKQDPKPLSFIQYLFSGKGLAEMKGASHEIVEKIAEAILKLSDFGEEGRRWVRRKHYHRHILQLLEATPELRRHYQDLVTQLTLSQDIPSFESWSCGLSEAVRRIAETLAGSKLSSEANDFLKWDNEPDSIGMIPSKRQNSNNLFVHSRSGRTVPIQAASIHSVKGQTHTATLVLETFWYAHNLESLLPWFVGSKKGWKKVDGPRQESRLKLHYVAMTRPTHLLCLAMKQSTLNDEQKKAIQGRGCRLVQVQADGSTVLLPLL